MRKAGDDEAFDHIWAWNGKLSHQAKHMGTLLWERSLLQQTQASAAARFALTSSWSADSISVDEGVITTHPTSGIKYGVPGTKSALGPNMEPLPS